MPDADSNVTDVVNRLFTKGLVNQVDGGHLTALGKTTAEHAHAISGLLTTG